jgi:transcriptional regulator with XRE-family HTH domain
MTEIMKRRAGLADFLKTRRARLRPEQFDLPTFQRRRTRGLRREELAQLVGVGVSWYTWLEQGRDIQVSNQVLERLADILRLNEEERRHLFVLARGPVALPDEQGSEKPGQYAIYQAVLDGFIYPARLLDRRLNIVAWNECAHRIFGYDTCRTEREYNVVWSMFMNPVQREIHVNWERDARSCLASLRTASDQYPDNIWLTKLAADLQQASPEFRAWWPEHNIRLGCGNLYEINLPQVGLLVLQPNVFGVPSRPDLQMVVYTPYVEDDTAAKLRALMAEGNQFSLF